MQMYGNYWEKIVRLFLSAFPSKAFQSFFFCNHYWKTGFDGCICYLIDLHQWQPSRLEQIWRLFFVVPTQVPTSACIGDCSRQLESVNYLDSQIRRQERSVHFTKDFVFKTNSEVWPWGLERRLGGSFTLHWRCRVCTIVLGRLDWGVSVLRSVWTIVIHINTRMSGVD